MVSLGSSNDFTRGTAPQRGFTLLEVMIAISILGVGSIVLLTSIISITEMNARNREDAVAQRGLQEMAEVIKGSVGDFDNAFIAHYRKDETTFTIDNLWPTETDVQGDHTLMEEDQDGTPMRALCRITLYLNERNVPTGAGGDEDHALDLNGDGDVSDDWTEPVQTIVEEETGKVIGEVYGNNLVGVGLSAHWRTGRGESRDATSLTKYFLVARSK